jgi:pantoate--beta-alanine ligase
MQTTAEKLRVQGKRIGVVPTMGFLHEGHLSLIRIARQNADMVITTLFVNPTQFAPTEDFGKYPRDIQRDTRLAESAGSDFLFLPETKEMYPGSYVTYISVEQLTTVLEGKVRPTHFRGVTTVVAKLFNITKPHVAVFGQKDAQQAIVIKRMAHDLNVDVHIVVAPIVREPDGLAMSSRNVYLLPSERAQSVVLSQSLKQAEKMIAGGERRTEIIRAAMLKLIAAQPSAVVDYVSLADPDTLQEKSMIASGESVLVSLAVRFGATRLIDNSLITAAAK